MYGNRAPALKKPRLRPFENSDRISKYCRVFQSARKFQFLTGGRETPAKFFFEKMIVSHARETAAIFFFFA